MKKILTFLILILMAPSMKAQSTLKGDMNNDGVLTITDVMIIVNKIIGLIPEDDYTTCPDNNHPHAIDLGLPSGTKWSCCNIDATTPEDYGGYYAWGETEGKLKYDWSSYIHCDGTSSTCHNLNGEICGTQYDVAQEKWKNGWLMPTIEQNRELIDNCTYEWTTINDIKGIMFTGTNNARIFIPAGGYYSDNGIINNNSEGAYWSSQNQSNQSNASILYFKPNYASADMVSELCRGLNVRPVIMPQHLQLSSSNLNLFINIQNKVNIISGSGSYTVVSNNTKVATAVIDENAIVVTAVGGGSALITVTDNQNEQSATINVNVKSLYAYTSCPDDNHPHAINLGLPSGTLWSCCNLDSSSPDGVGGFYAWGETETKEQFSNNNYKYFDNSIGDYIDAGVDICGSEHDVVQVKWKGYWQMPSRNQIYELVKYCNFSWSSFASIPGGKFTSKVNGSSIFLPGTGFYMNSELKDSHSGGYYWTGTGSNSSINNAFILCFGYVNANGYNCVSERQYGLAIRPIAK